MDSNRSDFMLYLPTFGPSDTEANDASFPLVEWVPHTHVAACSFWPTPVASTWGATGQRGQLDRLVEQGIITPEDKRRMSGGGSGRWVNPEFYECLMGFPTKWTEIAPSATPLHPSLPR